MTIGEKIARARRARGFTQEELADRLGVSRQAVSKWESDAALPETDKLVRLCRLLQVSCDALLLEEGTLAAPAAQPAAAEARQAGESGAQRSVQGEEVAQAAEPDARAGGSRAALERGVPPVSAAEAAPKRRSLSGGALALVLVCVVVGALLALVAAVLFFALPDRLDEIFGTLALFFGVGCALVLIGALVAVFYRR